MTYLKNISSKNGLIKSLNKVAGEIPCIEDENPSSYTVCDRLFSMSKKTNNFL